MEMSHVRITFFSIHQERLDVVTKANTEVVCNVVELTSQQCWHLKFRGNTSENTKDKLLGVLLCVNNYLKNGTIVTKFFKVSRKNHRFL